jgi:hypothetical protein
MDWKMIGLCRPMGKAVSLLLFKFNMDAVTYRQMENAVYVINMIAKDYLM